MQIDHPVKLVVLNSDSKGLFCSKHIGLIKIYPWRFLSFFFLISSQYLRSYVFKGSQGENKPEVFFLSFNLHAGKGFQWFFPCRWWHRNKAREKGGNSIKRIVFSGTAQNMNDCVPRTATSSKSCFPPRLQPTITSSEHVSSKPTTHSKAYNSSLYIPDPKWLWL